MGPPEATQIVQQRLRERHDALLVALADDAHLQVGAVDCADFQACRLADPQAAAVYNSEAHLVDWILHADQERPDLGVGQGDWQGALLGGTDLFFFRTTASPDRGSNDRGTESRRDWS